jgi:hypothetical protein
VTATGTVYALVDPRDDEIRYIGQTTRTLPQRLKGHLSRPAWRVEKWIAELRTADLGPQIVALRENVPAGELLTAEREEITRILAAGGELLNDHGRTEGCELNSRRLKAERTAAWGELANLALATLGGPLPPGEVPATEIPDRGTWGELRRLGGSAFKEYIDRNLSIAAEVDCANGEDRSRLLSLAAWYAVAAYPWRSLASIGGLPLDDASFIAWAGQDAETREALEFLAAHGDGTLAKLSIGWHSPFRPQREPGDLLGVVAAAYSGVTPSASIRRDVIEVLCKFADDHELTQPMADLLMRLDPGALDSVFGKDVAARLDVDLGLVAGTSGRVIRALLDRMAPVNDPRLRRVADRAAQALPVTALPDYRGWWSGPSIPAARVISASLVRAGLAEPDDMTTEEYLSYVRDLWAPQLAEADEEAA